MGRGGGGGEGEGGGGRGGGEGGRERGREGGRERECVVSASDQVNCSSNRKAEHEKRVADSLLQDIIPTHVIETIQMKQEYSESHKDVGVVFISITNFDDFYDEAFQGGALILPDTIRRTTIHVSLKLSIFPRQRIPTSSERTIHGLRTASYQETLQRHRENQDNWSVTPSKPSL